MAAGSWDTPSPAHGTAQRDSPGALGFPLASRRAGVSLAGSVQSPLRRISPALQSASSRLRFSFFMVACGSISREEIQPPRKPPERQSRRRALSKPATAYSLYSSPKAPGGQAEGSAWRCIWKCWVLMSTWTKPPQTQPAHIPGEAPGLFPRALAHCGQSELWDFPAPSLTVLSPPHKPGKPSSGASSYRSGYSREQDTGEQSPGACHAFNCPEGQRGPAAAGSGQETQNPPQEMGSANTEKAAKATYTHAGRVVGRAAGCRQHPRRDGASCPHHSPGACPCTA